MMQSNMVSAMLMKTETKDMGPKSPLKTKVPNNDTFMKILNDRLQVRTGSAERNSKGTEKTKAATEIIGKAAQTKTPKNQTAVIEENKVDTTVTEEPKVSGGEVISETPEVKAKEQENTEETIMALESIIAMLEKLMAGLNVEITESVPLSAQSESIIPLEIGNISNSELLAALLEGNTQKIQEMLKNADVQSIPTEFDGLMENIQKLLGKITEQQDVTVNMSGPKVESGTEEMSREELMGRLKAQCAEMIDKLSKKVEALKTSQPMEQETKVQATDHLVTNATDAGRSSEFQPAEQDVKPKTEIKTDSKTDEIKEKAVNVSREHEQVQKVAIEEKSEPVNGDFIVQEGQNTQQHLSAKVEKTAIPMTEKPSADPVTNQVMMKVKLMAGENKQEMEMHLKPEHLGKLSLKIIHEHGEILAKITAESEQVKGILESNMQLLKDALEKSGLSVQSLSVSVGGGQERKNQFEQQSEGNNGGYAVKANRQPRESAGTETIYEASRVLRNYYGQSSSIDLTA